MIDFVWPWIFLLLPAPLLARWLKSKPHPNDAALRVPSDQLFALAAVEATGTRREHPLSAALLYLAWLSLIFALARPQWLGEPVAMARDGRDLMIAVDLSASMGTEDMLIKSDRYSRLEVVKHVLADFVNRRHGDRLGLIVFGSLPYVYVPLTFDHQTLATLLQAAPPSIAGNKTAIGDAIGLATLHLRDRPAEQRVLILLTDGANTAGEVAPLKAAELAKAHGVRVHTIGVGAETFRVPGFFGTEFGARIINPSAGLDQETLTQIATLTGGRFFRARDPAELEAIYQLLDQIEPIDQAPELTRPTRSLFHWPLSFCLFNLGVLALLRLWAAVGNASKFTSQLNAVGQISGV